MIIARLLSYIELYYRLNRNFKRYQPPVFVLFARVREFAKAWRKYYKAYTNNIIIIFNLVSRNRAFDYLIN